MSPTVEETIETLESQTATMSLSEESTALALRSPDSSISSARKAAILCLSLGEDAATALFKHLDEDEVQILSRELALLPDVKSDMSGIVIEEFHQLLTARSYVTMGGVDYAKRLLNKSFGSEHA